MLKAMQTAALLAAGLAAWPESAVANGSRTGTSALTVRHVDAGRCYRRSVDRGRLQRRKHLKLDAVRVSFPPPAAAVPEPASTAVAVRIAVHPIAAPGWYEGEARCIAEQRGRRRRYDCEIDEDRGWFSLLETGAGTLRLDIVLVALKGPNGAFEIGPRDADERSFSLVRQKPGGCRREGP